MVGQMKNKKYLFENQFIDKKLLNVQSWFKNIGVTVLNH